jgi:tRNA(Ile)-lysidine synthase
MILPPGTWTSHHHRLHLVLRRHPDLLPSAAPLLVAVSGGQDSMALVGLLVDLQRLYRWQLWLWHGDHRWRSESTAQAAALGSWAAAQGLQLVEDSWHRSAGANPSESSARDWRYQQLRMRAQERGCQRIVTGHTASDRAETLLLNLARGSHRRGLASLQRQRSLGQGLELVRPLLGFSRGDTSLICEHLRLPVWLDSSNEDPSFSRNRLRLEVMPVLNHLHPGADRRLARLAEQLAEAERDSQELIRLALERLTGPAPAEACGPALLRPALCALQRSNQSQLLQAWLESHTGRRWPSRQIDHLLDRLPPGQRPGQADLGGGWRLHWRGLTLWLVDAAAAAAP